MRHKEDENGGKIVDGITNTFDPTTALPYDLPVVAPACASRPSIVMPAYYDLWARGDGRSVLDARRAGRARLLEAGRATRGRA